MEEEGEGGKEGWVYRVMTVNSESFIRYCRLWRRSIKKALMLIAVLSANPPPMKCSDNMERETEKGRKKKRINERKEKDQESKDG